MRVLVIGAGVIGTAVAWELLQRGAEVVLLDSAAVGGYTSAASAGMVNPFSLTPDDTPALPMYWQSLQMYPDWTRTLHEQTGIDPEWRSGGCLRVALTPSDAEHLRASLAWIQRYDTRAELIDSQAACQLEPALNHEIAAALYLPSEGWVNAERLLRALHRVVQLKGANLHTDTPALRLVVDNATVRRVQTAHGILEGDTVVVAAGAWAGMLTQWLGLDTPTTPVRGVILILGDLPVPVQRILSSPVGYLVPRADGTVLFGATREHARFDARVTVNSYALLTDNLKTLALPLMQATVLGHTVGLRPDTPDHNPYIGAVAGIERLYLAAGHAYHGILLAPATARAIADLVLNGTTDLPIAPFNPNRYAKW